MSKFATFDQVRAGLANYGERATVVTVGDDGRPHVGTSLIEIDTERLVIRVGGRSRSNLVERPVVTLVWQPERGDEYLLIVDCNLDSLGEPDDRGVSRVVLEVDGGIQHRLAGLDPGASSCRPVDAD